MACAGNLHIGNALQLFSLHLLKSTGQTVGQLAAAPQARLLEPN